MTLAEFEESTRDQVNARRNYLMGLWAGQRMGLSENELAGYVRDVMASDHQEPGPYDVVRKVQSDFERANMSVAEWDVLQQMQAFEGSVRAELLTTD